MAVTDYKNIITGEANMFVSATSATSWVDVGATQNGVELSWEPNMVDIEVDQFGDAARVIQSKVKVSVKTSLAEITLANLALVWGYTGSYNSNSYTPGNTGGGMSGSALYLGIHSTVPEERQLKVVGPAAGYVAGTPKKRTFIATRAMSAATSAGSFQRNDNFKLPVEFRILPDQSKTGQEYGTIVDAAGEPTS